VTSFAAEVAAVAPCEARGIGKKMVVIVVRAGAVIGCVLFGERDRLVAAWPKGGGHRASLVFLRIHEERVASVQGSEVV
jgi:hypothetical protein